MVLSLLSGCGSQTPVWPGAVFNGPGADELLDVLVVGDQVVAVGYRDGRVGEDRLEPGGNAAAVMVAFDREGTVRWEQVFDTDQSETLDAVTLQGETLWAVGRTQGTFPGQTPAGQTDVLLISAPLAGGEPGPVIQFGDERPQRLNRIALDAEGAVLLAGYDETFVPTNYVEDWENGVTARYRTGEGAGLDWMRRSPLPASDFLLGMAPAGVPGEMFVAGMVTAGSGRGPFVRRERADGTVAWHTQLGTISLDAATAVEVGPDGKVYVAGATFAQLGAHTFGQQDVFVAVLDPDTGSLQRVMQAGSGESDWPWDLAVAGDGTVYAAGGTLGALPGFTFAGEQDVFVIRFSPEGEWSGAWQAGSPQWEDLAAVAVDPQGGVFVAGHSEGELVPGQGFGGQRDGFLLRVAAKDFGPGGGSSRPE